MVKSNIFVAAAERIDSGKDRYACSAVCDACTALDVEFSKSHDYQLYYIECMKGARNVRVWDPYCGSHINMGWFGNWADPKRQEQRILSLLFTALMAEDGITF